MTEIYNEWYASEFYHICLDTEAYQAKQTETLASTIRHDLLIDFVVFLFQRLNMRPASCYFSLGLTVLLAEVFSHQLPMFIKFI